MRNCSNWYGLSFEKQSNANFVEWTTLALVMGRSQLFRSEIAVSMESEVAEHFVAVNVVWTGGVLLANEAISERMSSMQSSLLVVYLSIILPTTATEHTSSDDVATPK